MAPLIVRWRLLLSVRESTRVSKRKQRTVTPVHYRPRGLREKAADIRAMKRLLSARQGAFASVSAAGRCGAHTHLALETAHPNRRQCEVATRLSGKRGQVMSGSVGIAAYGSLLEDPDAEIETATADQGPQRSGGPTAHRPERDARHLALSGPARSHSMVVSGNMMPFKVEFVRSSNRRGGAPTLGIPSSAWRSKRRISTMALCSRWREPGSSTGTRQTYASIAVHGAGGGVIRFAGEEPRSTPPCTRVCQPGVSTPPPLR